ncbi:hypothetical protein Sjap_020035 [Stephania japonica]|uniref:Uncharacterized protein n=1 Tax=Stephania japonica TaxID=461633 RepID=A0AAP0HZX4_9MAGN
MADGDGDLISFKFAYKGIEAWIEKFKCSTSWFQISRYIFDFAFPIAHLLTYARALTLPVADHAFRLSHSIKRSRFQSPLFERASSSVDQSIRSEPYSSKNPYPSKEPYSSKNPVPSSNKSSSHQFSPYQNPASNSDSRSSYQLKSFFSIYPLDALQIAVTICVWIADRGCTLKHMTRIPERISTDANHDVQPLTDRRVLARGQGAPIAHRGSLGGKRAPLLGGRGPYRGQGSLVEVKLYQEVEDHEEGLALEPPFLVHSHLP